MFLIVHLFVGPKTRCERWSYLFEDLINYNILLDSGGWIVSYVLEVRKGTPEGASWVASSFYLGEPSARLGLHSTQRRNFQALQSDALSFRL